TYRGVLLGLKARKGERMVGRMSVDAILSVKRGCDSLAAVRSLVERAEGVKVVKWIEFPDSILVFLMIPGDVDLRINLCPGPQIGGSGTGLISRTASTEDTAERNSSGC